MNTIWKVFKAVLKRLLQLLITAAAYNKQARFPKSRAPEWGHICQYSASVWERNLAEHSIDNFPFTVIDADLSAKVWDAIFRPETPSLSIQQ